MTVSVELNSGGIDLSRNEVVFRSPYQDWDWRQIWKKRNRIAPDDGFDLEFRAGGRLLATLPMRVIRYAGIAVSRIDDGGTGNLNSPTIFDPAWFEATDLMVGTIIEAIRRARPDIDLVWFDKLPATHAGRRNPLMSLGVPRRHRTPIYRGAIEPDFATWERQRFSSAARKLRRRRLRQLEDMLGPVQISRAGDEAEVTRLIAAFQDQRDHAHRAGRVPNVFRDGRSHAALVELALASLGKHDGFHLYALEAGGHVCAVSGVAVQGAYHSGFMVSHDADLRRFGPGKLLQHEVIRILAAAGACAFDLGLGDDRYKQDWAEREWLMDIAVPVTARGQIAAACLIARNGLLRISKQMGPARRLATAVRFAAASRQG